MPCIHKSQNICLRGVKDDVMNINGQHVVSKTLLDLIYGQNVYHKPNVKTISKVKPHPV